MIKGHWNVLRAMVIGVPVGVVGGPTRAYFETPEVVSNIPSLIGLAVGGGIGGAFLFGFVAFVRNLFVRS
jgi:hypothetical protein